MTINRDFAENLRAGGDLSGSFDVTGDVATFDNLTVNTAATVPYDNSVSGLTAANIQSAITELNTLVGGGNVGSQATWNVYEFTTAGNDTQFDISTQGSPAPSYVPGYVKVYLNGLLLSESDYTAVDGSTVNFSPAIVDAGQIVSIVVLDSFNTAELLRVFSIDSSASTNSLVLDSSSNFGIGTDNPTGKLTISNNGAGGFEFTPDTTTFSVANSNYIASYDRSASAYRDIVFDLGGAENQSIRFKAGGNVGIGTSSPSHKLSLSTTGTDGIKLGVDGQTYYHIVRPNGDGLYLGADEGNTGGVGADIRFNVKTDEKMRITTDGNVIINKSNFSSLPATSKLNIFGDGITLRLDGSSQTTKSILFRQTSVTNPGEMYADGSLRLRTEDANTRITFHTNSSGSDNERMRIDASGNVGIGTDSPDVFSRAYSGTTVGISSASGESAFMINSSGTNVAALEIGRAGARETLIYDTSTTTEIGSVTSKPVLFLTGGIERMSIDSNGNVGIGTGEPKARLVVQDNITHTSNPPTYRGSLIIASDGSQTSAGGLEFHSSIGGGAGYGGRIVTDSSANMLFFARSNATGWTKTFSLDPTGSAALPGTLTLNNNTEKFVAPVYRGTATGVSNAGYTTLFTATGGGYGSTVKFTLVGTASNVVVNLTTDLIVGHFEDILISTQSGFYTTVTLKVTSDNNAGFAVEATTNHASAVNLDIEVFPFSNEQVTFTNSHGYTGSSLTHTAYYGHSISGTGGDFGNIRTAGNITVERNIVAERAMIKQAATSADVSALASGSVSFSLGSLVNSNRGVYEFTLFGFSDGGAQQNGGVAHLYLMANPDDVSFTVISQKTTTIDSVTFSGGTLTVNFTNTSSGFSMQGIKASIRKMVDG